MENSKEELIEYGTAILREEGMSWVYITEKMALEAALSAIKSENRI